MPRTYNGIGTKYYGASDRQADGSFVTTEWLAVFAPVIPLRSLRVWYLGNQTGFMKGSSQFYNLIGPAPLDTKQVLQLYAMHGVTWAAFILILLSGFAETVGIVFILAAFIFWIWIVPDVIFKAK